MKRSALLNKQVVILRMAFRARKVLGTFEKRPPGKLVVKLQSSCFEKLIFEHIFDARKTKRIAKFDVLEPRCCKDIKGNRNRPEKFRDF